MSDYAKQGGHTSSDEVVEPPVAPVGPAPGAQHKVNEATVRGYELGIEVYGPDVFGPHPVVVLSAPGIALTITDRWDELEQDFQTIIDRIRARRG